MNDLIDFVEDHGGSLSGEARDKLVVLVASVADERVAAMPCYKIESDECWLCTDDEPCPRCAAIRKRGDTP